MLPRLLTFAARAGCVLWCAAAPLLLVSLLLAADEAPGTDDLAVMLGAAILAIVFDRFRYEYDVHGTRLVTAPDAGFLLLLVVAVEPAVAALGGALAALLGGAPRHQRSYALRTFHLATGILATGVPAALVHDAFGNDPGGRTVLAAVIVGAATRAALLLASRLIVAQAASPSGGRSLLRDTPAGTLFLIETGLPTATVAAAGPFLASPALGLLVVLAGQLLTWRLLALQHAQFTDRRDAARLLDSFERYVPSAVARSALAPGDPGSGHQPLRAGGERRELTVLFLDVRGFTTWAEHTDPAEVFDELNVLLGELAEAVLAEDGTIDKFTGDGLMAIWNAPTRHDDHAARAVRTIPRLLMRLHECNLRREASGSPPLHIGVGIATGPAVVGNVGHRERLAFTAIGDTVNRAARIEQATREVGVSMLLDEATFLAVPLELQRQLMRLESIAVKGRTDRVRLYAPTAVVHRERGRAA